MLDVLAQFFFLRTNRKLSVGEFVRYIFALFFIVFFIVFVRLFIYFSCVLLHLHYFSLSHVTRYCVSILTNFGTSQNEIGTWTKAKSMMSKKSQTERPLGCERLPHLIMPQIKLLNRANARCQQLFYRVKRASSQGRASIILYFATRKCTG